MRHRDTCFELNGARVLGDRDMPEDARRALGDVIDAVKKHMAENPPQREDCRYCATSDEDCKNTPDEDMGRCCDRCRHPIVRTNP